jgi:hypothetical protein
MNYDWQIVRQSLSGGLKIHGNDEYFAHRHRTLLEAMRGVTSQQYFESLHPKHLGEEMETFRGTVHCSYSLQHLIVPLVPSSS